jgi:DNA-binding response OmpR family regulator
MRLMIVDDRTSTQKLVRKFLELPGITFCECASGDEAVLRARVFKPDWVTMAVHMPGRNGFQSAEDLRKEHPSVQIIIITDLDEPHYQQLSSSIGAVGLIYMENLASLRMMLIKEMCDLNEMPPGSESRMPDMI